MVYIPHLSSRKCDRTRPKKTILCGAKNTFVLGSKYLLQLRDIDRRSNMFSFTKTKAFCMLLFSIFFVKIECEGYKDSFGNIRNIFRFPGTLFDLFLVLTSLRSNKWFIRNFLLFLPKITNFNLIFLKNIPQRQVLRLY
jgi:hypothetical protein